MARISLQAIHKRYGSGAAAHHALRGVSLEIEQGEFVALLGPSGSGKTTLLRAIAGLEAIDSGCIRLGADRVAAPGVHVPPEDRNVGVVFQNHALWPHLSVIDNVLFPLREAGIARAPSLLRAQRALDQVELAGLGERMPSQLSGGQKQRVSLARAMVAAPRVILFDEPLASLDVELRRGMMKHIAQARTSDNTMVYVTHNQEEALSLADRVVVLADGVVQQVDTPRALCRQPRNVMVASFVAGGNCITARCAGVCTDGRVPVTLGHWSWLARCDQDVAIGQTVVMCVAQTAFVCVNAESEGLALVVDHVFFQGTSGYSVDARLADGLGGTMAVNLVLPFDAHPCPGDSLRVQIHDAWVLPEVVP